jgi:hypothetical protein
MRAESTARIKEFLRAIKVSAEPNSSAYHSRLKPVKEAVLFDELNENRMSVSIGI